MIESSKHRNYREANDILPNQVIKTLFQPNISGMSEGDVKKMVNVGIVIIGSVI